jgi:hypothetical protein
MTMTSDHAPRISSITPLDRVAQGLGLFSIALGLTELAFPGAMARALGLENRKGLLRAYGLREIAAGIGALQPNAGPALWSRLAGDLMDLATLAQGRSHDDENKRRNAAAAMAAVGAVALVDLVAAAAWTAQTARSSETRDYSDRSGFPNGVDAARGALADYTPKDYRVTPRPGENGQHERRPI